MKYFIEHWRGECSVSRAGWLGSIVAILLVLPTNFWEVHSFLSLNNIGNFDDIMVRVQNGDVAAFVMPSVFIQALNLIVETGVLVWWTVGAWRSCFQPDVRTGQIKSWWFFKSMIVLAAIIQVYEVADFFISASVE
jgi:hypothetical protein